MAGTKALRVGWWIVGTPILLAPLAGFSALAWWHHGPVVGAASIALPLGTLGVFLVSRRLFPRNDFKRQGRLQRARRILWATWITGMVTWCTAAALQTRFSAADIGPMAVAALTKSIAEVWVPTRPRRKVPLPKAARRDLKALEAARRNGG